MKEKLRKYVEDMVKDIPKTRSVVDLKEEIIGNMEERYDDLRAEGYGEQDAFDCTINAMGDIRSLFEEENRENGGGKGEPVMAGERPEKKNGHTVKILVLGAALGGLLFLLGAGMVAARVDRGHAGGKETFEASGRMDRENGSGNREDTGENGPGAEKLETGETGPGAEMPGIGKKGPSAGQPEIGENGPGTEKPGTEETGSGVGAAPGAEGSGTGEAGEIPDGWTKLGDGGILKRQIPMDGAEDIQISYILTDLTVEVTDSEEILLEEEYITSWEEIRQTKVSSGSHRVEIVNDYPSGSQGKISFGFSGLKFEDEEKRRIPVSARIQIPEDFRGELEINTVSGDITLPRFEGESLEIATVSGDLDGGTIYGAVEGESVSGDLSIEKAAAGAELSTVSGKMTIGEAQGDISMESVSGELLVEKAEDPRFKFEAQWVSGGLETDFDGQLEREKRSARGIVAGGDGREGGEGLPKIQFTTTSGEMECYIGK